MPATVSREFPLFVNVTVCAALVLPTNWLLNVKLVADKVTAGPEEAAVPVKLISCGLSLASSEMVIAPALVPAAAGVNVMLMVQLAPAAMLPPHVLT